MAPGPGPVAKLSSGKNIVKTETTEDCGLKPVRPV